MSAILDVNPRRMIQVRQGDKYLEARVPSGVRVEIVSWAFGELALGRVPSGMNEAETQFMADIIGSFEEAEGQKPAEA